MKHLNYLIKDYKPSDRGFIRVYVVDNEMQIESKVNAIERILNKFRLTGDIKYYNKMLDKVAIIKDLQSEINYLNDFLARQ